MVNRYIEESLDLVGMKIHGDYAADSRGGQKV
jgi:hypothetical protein